LFIEIAFELFQAGEEDFVGVIEKFAGSDRPAVITADLWPGFVFHAALVIGQRAAFGFEFNMPFIVVVDEDEDIVMQEIPADIVVIPLRPRPVNFHGDITTALRPTFKAGQRIVFVRIFLSTSHRYHLHPRKRMYSGSGKGFQKVFGQRRSGCAASASVQVSAFRPMAYTSS